MKILKVNIKVNQINPGVSSTYILLLVGLYIFPKECGFARDVTTMGQNRIKYSTSHHVDKTVSLKRLVSKSLQRHG